MRLSIDAAVQDIADDNGSNAVSPHTPFRLELF